mgnify:FL=1
MERMSREELEAAVQEQLWSSYQYSAAAAGACVLAARFLPTRYRIMPLIPLALAGAAADFATGRDRAAPYQAALDKLVAATATVPPPPAADGSSSDKQQ